MTEELWPDLQQEEGMFFFSPPASRWGHQSTLCFYCRKWSWLHNPIWRHGWERLGLCSVLSHTSSGRAREQFRLDFMSISSYCWCRSDNINRVITNISVIINVTASAKEISLFHNFSIPFKCGVELVTSAFFCGFSEDNASKSSSVIIIIIIIIIFIYCSCVVTWWQWLFYMYTKHEIGYY